MRIFSTKFEGWCKYFSPIKRTVSQTAHVQVINQKWSDISSLWSVKQNGVNKRRTILTVTEAVETTLAVRSLFNSDSGRKQEREKSRRRIWLEENMYKSWLQAKLEATYSSTSNNEFAMNLLSLENRRRQDKRQKSNYKQIWFIYIINLITLFLHGLSFLPYRQMSPQCTSPAAFEKDNNDYSFFSAWCCKTFCIHSLQIDFPWRKNIRFCDF